MKLADVSRVRDGCLEVDILVSPRSNRSGFEGYDEWRRRLIIRVKAPPLDGRANKEVEETFREVTGRPSKVISGQVSRQKTISIEGDPEDAMMRLEACDGSR